MLKKVDYIIVGQGLAGFCFALKLIKERKTFLVIDKGIKNSASYVAAGIINPVALKRLILGWRADDFLIYNSSFYKEVADLLGKDYLFAVPIKKLISSKDDISFWHHRCKNDNLSSFLNEKLKASDAGFLNKDILKVGEVKQTFRVNIAGLLKDFRTYLKNNNSLIEVNFNSDDLKENNVFKDYHFDHIVFCEGAKGILNPFFKQLPFNLNKGQTVTINTDDLSSESILKKNVFVMPTDKSAYFKVGATYSWSWESELPEKEKTTLIKEEISKMLSINYSVVKEEAGVRPATKDRRPFIGESSIQKNYYIFNGLGSKGCLMAPLLASELFNHIEFGTALNSELDIKRFNKP